LDAMKAQGNSVYDSTALVVFVLLNPMWQTVKLLA